MKDESVFFDTDVVKERAKLRRQVGSNSRNFYHPLFMPDLKFTCERRLVAPGEANVDCTLKFDCDDKQLVITKGQADSRDIHIDGNSSVTCLADSDHLKLARFVSQNGLSKSWITDGPEEMFILGRRGDKILIDYDGKRIHELIVEHDEIVIIHPLDTNSAMVRGFFWL